MRKKEQQQSAMTSAEMGKWTEQSFFKGKSPNGQNTHEEIFNIPLHKGNANKNC
jgi:hypothetical protein